MSFQDPSKWAGAWGTRVSASGDKWATNFVAAGPAIFQKAADSVSNWQSAVASPAAAAAFVAGLKAANFSQVTVTVNGAGKGKYTDAGRTKQSKYATFAGIFGPKLQNIVNGLPARGPRGSSQNRTRLNQMLDAVQATRGTN